MLKSPISIQLPLRIPFVKFSAKIYKIGINPYVLLPATILKKLFIQSGKEKGNIPVKLVINEQSFIQNLVRYCGKWRLYLNTPMRKIAGKDVGDVIEVDIEFDPSERITPMHPKFERALKKNSKAKNNFDKLSPSKQKEILRYINSLKTEESIDRNIIKAFRLLSH